MANSKKRSMKRYVRTNIIWVICVLVALLLIFVTKDFSSQSKLTEMIGFAATLTSLILAIIAIFQSIISSATAIQEKAKAEAFNEQTRHMLIDISQKLPVIDSKITAVDSVIRGGGGGINLGSQKKDPNLPTPEYLSGAVDLMITRTSLIGLMSARAIIMSVKSGRAIPLKLDDMSLSWHMSGYISGLSAMSWLNFYIGADEISVSEVSKEILSHESKFVDEYNKRDKSGAPEVVSTMKYLIQYFDSKE